MLKSLRSLNLLLMFLLELAVYAAVVLWGVSACDQWLVKVLLGVAAPVAMIGVWSLFGSPRARYPARGAGRVALEVLWFGAGAAALAAAGRPVWATVFVCLYVVNAALRLRWKQ